MPRVMRFGSGEHMDTIAGWKIRRAPDAPSSPINTGSSDNRMVQLHQPAYELQAWNVPEQRKATSSANSLLANAREMLQSEV